MAGLPAAGPSRRRRPVEAVGADPSGPRPGRPGAGCPHPAGRSALLSSFRLAM